MAPKLDLEARMVIKKLRERGISNVEVGRVLGVTEGAVRYHARRLEAEAIDGRSKQQSAAHRCREAIVVWLEQLGPRAAVNLRELHGWLISEHGYEGSLRGLQRYFRAAFPRPKRRARRRVETPPGAQAQIDWAEFRGIRIGGEAKVLYAFHMLLSHSRHDAIVWSERKDTVAWLHCHNECFRRLGGIPATGRVDNEKTAVSRGAGAWGEINPTYLRYSQVARFHIDACPPRSPEYKGKVERRIRDQRLQDDPRRHDWSDLAALQSWTDARMLASSKRRRCPATGTSVFEAWEQEKRYLAPLPILPEPFDLIATRRVGEDCLVSFEGRFYSVPFHLLGRRVEARGCSGIVQILADAEIVAVHPRHTQQRIVIDEAHYEGPSTETVIAPVPLGRMGRRLSEIAAMPPETRPLDLYEALAEAAR